MLPKDDDGNTYVFFNRSRVTDMIPFDSLEVAARLKYMFYITSLAVCDYYYRNPSDDKIDDDIDLDQSGVIAINIVLNMTANPTRNMKDMIDEAFPIRAIKMHVVFYQTNLNSFSLDKYIIPSFIAINVPLLSYVANVILHYCTSERDAESKIIQRGIPLQCIPSVLGGYWTYDAFDDWFEEKSRCPMTFCKDDDNPISDDIIVNKDLTGALIPIEVGITHLLDCNVSDASSYHDEFSISAPTLATVENHKVVTEQRSATYRNESIAEVLNCTPMLATEGATSLQTNVIGISSISK